MYSREEISSLTAICAQVTALNNGWAWPNWPLTVFLSDIKKYPPTNRERFLQALLHSTDDYLLFFQESRGYERPFGYYVHLWKELENNPLLLHMEKDISYLLLLSIEEHIPEDEDLVTLIQLLSKEDRERWSNIIANINMQFSHQPEERDSII